MNPNVIALAQLGVHLAQDGPWTSVLLVVAPPYACEQFIALP